MPGVCGLGRWCGGGELARWGRHVHASRASLCCGQGCPGTIGGRHHPLRAHHQAHLRRIVSQVCELQWQWLHNNPPLQAGRQSCSLRPNHRGPSARQHADSPLRSLPASHPTPTASNSTPTAADAGGCGAQAAATHGGPTATVMLMVQRVVSSRGPVRRTSCSTKVGWNTRFRKAMLKR